MKDLSGNQVAAQANFWVRVAKEAIDRPERYFPMAVFVLVLGLLIVAIHNVWVLGLPVAITIFGWILTIKGTLYLVYPRLVRVFDRWPALWLRHYIRVAGIVIAILGLLLVLHYLRVIWADCAQLPQNRSTDIKSSRMAAASQAVKNPYKPVQA